MIGAIYNINKKRSLPFQSKRLRGEFDACDIEHEVMKAINSEAIKANKKARTLRMLLTGGSGGRWGKDKGPSWNINRFFQRFKMKEPEECYEVTALGDVNNDVNDEEAMELTNGKDGTKQKKQNDRASHRIIDMDQLQEAMKGATCMFCAEKNEKNIVRNVTDEFVNYLKRNNISVPDNVVNDFKEQNKKSKQLSSLLVKEEHIGIATRICFECSVHPDHCQVIEPERSSFYGEKRLGKRNATEHLSWYSINNKLVLSMMLNGGGGSDAAKHLSFLDLPCSVSVGTTGFASVEADIGKVLWDFAKEAMEDALLEEIRLTLEDNMKEWENAPHPKQKNTYICRIYGTSFSPTATH